MTGSTSLTNFYDILSKDDTFLRIPKIQRDYAQGRTNEECTRKRVNFFRYLHSKISNDGAILDFVYGAKKDENGKEIIELLDGQQRTTTLFLLHVYALKRAKNYISNEDYNKHKNNLKKFCYETRESSRRFCEALIEKEYCVPAKTKAEAAMPLTDEIKNQNWYYSAYDDDQTVKAMLVALEDIHELFYHFNGADLWNALITDKKIKFHFVKIDKLGLTDEVYIKMNDRGKELEDFENLKAEIEEKIADDCQSITNEQYLIDEGSESPKNFKTNIDTKWTQFLWNYYKNYSEETEPYPTDKAFMRLMTACIIYNSDNKDVISLLHDKKKRSNISDFFFFKNGNLVMSRKEEPDDDDKKYSQNIFRMFCEFLDIYSSSNKILTVQTDITFWQNKDDDKDFVKKIFLDDEPTHYRRSVFFAHTLYFIRIRNKNIEFNSENYNDWMRVVRNLVYRQEGSGFGAGRAKNQPVLHEAKDMPYLLSLIKELSVGCDDIYSYLSKTDKTEANGVKQYAQEVIKAKLITKNKDVKELIHNLEDNFVLHGNIEFAILCADNDADNDNKENLDWKNIDWDKLKKIDYVFATYLNKPNEDLPHSFRRAILTIPKIDANDPDRECYAYQYSVLTKCLNVTRGNLFRDLEDLIYIISVENIFTMRYRRSAIYVKKLILALTEKTYEEIILDFKNNIPDNTPNWKINIINTDDKEWKENCYQPYIATDNEREGKYYLLKYSESPDELEGFKEINEKLLT